MVGVLSLAPISACVAMATSIHSRAWRGSMARLWSKNMKRNRMDSRIGACKRLLQLNQNTVELQWLEHLWDHEN